MTTKHGRAYVAPEFEGAVWKKSTYSGGSEAQCFECADVTRPHPGIAVRDSKNPEGPALLFTSEAFNSFVVAAGSNEFDLL
ncbi:DUF397 domain-containing protein [Streptomyces sp. NPDC058001]|uniref:DUF397 domain-containing protein n=1 Tax=Streptomyces sp. NPDC058001 TaxID=3346300 RepID=UPI0036E5C3C4